MARCKKLQCPKCGSTGPADLERLKNMPHDEPDLPDDADDDL
jgi:hypothetical protein